MTDLLSKTIPATTTPTMIPIARPEIGDEEKNAVLAVMTSLQLAQGAEVGAFEKEFAAACGVSHAVAVSSGTTALQVALMAHGIGAGDEVITASFSFIATGNSVLFCGARPVFVDIDPVTFNIDPEQIEAAITSRTKAIIPVHLFGQTADMTAIMDIARRYNLIVIEDACQAHLAEHRDTKAGAFGTGTFSFYPTKNMTCGEGGMITTNDAYIAEKASVIRAHGMRRRYYHDELGYNFRLTNIHAAIGRVQLRKLAAWNEKRRANAAYLTRRLHELGAGVITPKLGAGNTHVYHQYTVRIACGLNRDKVVARLTELGIGTGVYYPVPIHQQKVYLEMGYQERLPYSEVAAREVFSLPIIPSLTPDELERVALAVADAAAC